MSTADSEREATVRHRAAAVELQPFADVIARLRAPDGCPWDREQTHESLRRYAVEEVYELLDAIDSGDDDSLREELGDVLLQVVLHAQLASERGAFGLQEVADGIETKMIRRHPHVFGDASSSSAAEVEANWKAAKRAEGRNTLGGVPRSMPALERAAQISVRAAAVGFDFADAGDAYAKVEEEVVELRGALDEGDRQAIQAELGDAIFALANLARKLEMDPAECLAGTLARFEDRFSFIESELARSGRVLEDSSLEEMEALWQRAKGQPSGDM
jgi:tetrapyrrole methylase family protein/MazG family protein